MSKENLQDIISSIAPFDDIEKGHIKDANRWIESGSPIYRISKPSNPPKHLVSYFVLIDDKKEFVLLIEHLKSGLWLPAGGHVEIDEDPDDTVVREAKEELDINAEFVDELGAKPFFITVAETIGSHVHTDVTLWYLLKGNLAKKYNYNKDELGGYNWFYIDEISDSGYDFDPHFSRFLAKLKSLDQL